MSALPRQSYINSTYSLNNSSSKIISTGLKEDILDRTFKPIITIGGIGQNIELTVEEWNRLVENFEEISAFFQDEGHVRWRMPININENLNVIFTTSYNSKSVIIEKKVNSDLFNKSDSSDEPDKKKQRVYIPYVNFKQVTFDNLVAVTKLIKIKIVYLQSNSKSVQNCKQLLVQCLADDELKGSKLIIKEKIMSDLKSNNDELVNSLDLFNNVFNELYMFTM